MIMRFHIILIVKLIRNIIFAWIFSHHAVSQIDTIISDSINFNQSCSI